MLRACAGPMCAEVSPVVKSAEISAAHLECEVPGPWSCSYNVSGETTMRECYSGYASSDVIHEPVVNYCS